MTETKHETSEHRSPVAILLRCSCGWSRQISRKQNALARAAKVKAAWREHEQQIPQAFGDERQHQPASLRCSYCGGTVFVPCSTPDKADACASYRRNRDLSNKCPNR
jgi:hypothetical protein